MGIDTGIRPDLDAEAVEIDDSDEWIIKDVLSQAPAIIGGFIANPSVKAYRTAATLRSSRRRRPTRS
jgi:hypothetical protein